MADPVLARRLQEYARHCFNISSQALSPQRGGTATCLASSMLAQAAHFTLLGMIALSQPIEDDVDGPAPSLTHLARLIVNAEVRAFSDAEVEMLAYLDVIHTKPVTRVLLPDQVPQSIYSNTQTFIDRMIRELYDRVGRGE